jgi:hypothetical protein
MICAPERFDPAAQTYQPMVQFFGCKIAKSALMYLLNFDFGGSQRQRSFVLTFVILSSRGEAGKRDTARRHTILWIRAKRGYCGSPEAGRLRRVIYLYDANKIRCTSHMPKFGEGLDT